MSAFSRKHYELIAWELRNERQMQESASYTTRFMVIDEEEIATRLRELSRVTTMLSTLFASDNPRYDEEKFFRATGMHKKDGSFYPMRPPQ